MINYFKLNNKGFTLVEVLVSVAIFMIISVSIYSGFISIMRTMNIIRIKGIMTNLANEQFEIARNLPYQQVGTVNGIPTGILPQTQEVERDSKTFIIQTVIRNVDESFDGTFDGSPRDTSPADMKMIEITISCSSCDSSLAPISFTTKIAPKNLETLSTNGALVIRVFDASGLPVAGANINIINNNINPNINLNDETDINGVLTIVDAPPSVDGYQIIVTKSGYSTERTYLASESNPNPVKPNITVVTQQISQISFTIDQNSKINISSLNNSCVAVPNFDFGISGNKIIGIDPNVFKYDESFATNSLGKITLNDIEWDTYNIYGTDGTYDIIGTNPLLSLGVNPNIEQDIDIITAAKNGRRLLVVIRDQVTGLPITDAVVNLSNLSGYSKSITTNEGFLTQTDWSGGQGQDVFTDESMYLDSDGNIDDSLSIGDLSLRKVFGNYLTNGYITSSSFDIGSNSNFKQIIWSPGTEPIETGEESVKVQIATNTDNTTWNFLGPDGTSDSYYTYQDQNINIIHNGDRYVRYRLYLSTADLLFTPNISDISITYASSCIPPGQVSFSNLSSGLYVISVTKEGYQNILKEVNIIDNWSKEEITLFQ